MQGSDRFVRREPMATSLQAKIMLLNCWFHLFDVRHVNISISLLFTKMEQTSFPRVDTALYFAASRLVNLSSADAQVPFRPLARFPDSSTVSYHNSPVAE